VRVDILAEDNLDYTDYHGQHGKTIEVMNDSAGSLTGDKRDNTLYQVKLESSEEMDFRWRDLSPLFDKWLEIDHIN